MTVHDLPPPLDPEQGWRVGVSPFRLAANDRLATHKTGSRLLNVLARAEAEARDYHEALLLNTNGEVVEAAGANVFWIKRDTVVTSPSALGALPGITRAVVLELCTTEGIPTQKRIATVDLIRSADAVFLTNSAQGVIDVASINDTRLRGSPLVHRLREAYEDLLRRETT
jgi:branched-subunit amino acid aminotransferase/4-amino-4-deoxychorismate lyase